MKQLSILLIALFLSFAGYSQTAASYSFNALSGTFSSISGTGTLMGSTFLGDDRNQSSIPIGFTFTFCGTGYTQLSACSNGWLSLNNSTSTVLTNASTNITGAGFLMPYWDDLNGAGNTAYYQTTGTSPNRVFTFEYTNWGTWTGSGNCNMQVKLYETTNVIEFVYGTSTYASHSASIGIANSTSDWQSLPSSSTAPLPSSTTFTTNISTSPANGQIYQWTPPVPCSGTPTAGAASCSPATGGAGTAFTLSLTGFTLMSGMTFQWQSSPTGLAGSWTNIAGATTNPYAFTGMLSDTYYQCIVTCTASATSTTSTPILVTYTATPPCYPTSASWVSPSLVSYGINTFNITGFSGSTLADAGITGAASTSTGYLDRTAMTPVNMLQGGIYASNASWGTVSTHQELQVWIDFNDNGTFEATEEVTPVSGFSTGTTTNPTNFNITIPTTAATGIHNMRVRGIWEQIATTLGVAPAHLDPCLIGYPGITLHYYSGDVVDYRANIIAPCPFTAVAANGGAVCPGSPVSLVGTSTAPAYSWSGPAGFTSTALSPSAPGITTPTTYTFTATNGTCTITSTTTVGLLGAPPAPVVLPSVATICNGSSVTLTATLPPASVNLFPAQGWEAGVPTVAGTPVAGWNTTATSTGYITQVTAGSFPTATPHSGSYFADFHSWSYSGISAALISPAFSMTGITGGQISFWVYRDFGSFYTGTYYANEGWGIYMNTTGSLTGATSLGFVPRTADQPITGSVTGASTTTSSGWQQYTVSIPASFSGSTNYVLFKGTSLWGNDCYLDDVTATGLQPIAPPTWTPVTDLYTNPAFTTAYTAGTPALSVYVHPTTVTAGSTTSYIATITNGTCTSSDTSVVTVNPGVPAITGNSTLCVGASTTLSNSTAGGTWSSANTAVAVIDPVSGVVTGVATGVDTIYYTTPLGCSAYTTITITTFTTANTGNTIICNGGFTTTLANPSTGGTWSAATPSIVSVDPVSGVVTSGVVGTAIITYTMPWGCTDTSLINVLAPPTAITGLAEVCYNGGTTVLASTPTGGTWTSSNPSVASIDAATGVVTGYTAGTPTITYTYIPGCFATTSLLMKSNPAPIAGSASVCEAGSVTTLSDVTPGGVWSATGSSATIDPASGVVTGITAGSIAVTYTTPNSCYITTSVTVNPLPAPITGTFIVCQTNVTTLADASTGGTWTSGATSIATVSATGGVVGIIAGIAPITYTLPTGCKVSANVQVDAIPAAITGNNYVCNGYTSLLSDVIPSGTWSSSNTALATVNATGTVFGSAVGSVTITYTTGPGSCYATKPITISPTAPPTVAISASTGTTICAGTPVTFSSSITNGGTGPLYVWSINNVISSNATSYSYTPANGDVVRLWVLSSYACSIPDTSSAVLTMTVNPIVTPAVTMTTGMGDTVCTGMMTTISALPVASGTAPTYQWFVNSLLVSGASSYSYVPANGDVITVNMNSSAPCRTTTSVSSTKVLTVSPYVTPLVSLTSSLGPIMCDGYSDVFVASQINGGTAPTYQWAVNGVNTTTGSVFSYAPANGDDVSVMLTSNFPCVSAPTAFSHFVPTVLPIVQPIGVVTVDPGYIIPVGYTATFTCNILTGGGSAPTYQWFKNNIPLAGETGITYSTNVLFTGDSVSCQVTNTDDCSGVSIFNYVVVTIGSNVGVNNVSGGGSAFVLAPNPNNGTFAIKGNLGVTSNENIALEVTDMLGQVVYKQNAMAHSGEVNETIALPVNLASGMYLLNVRAQSGNTTFHFTVNK